MSSAAVRWSVALVAGTMFRPTAPRVWRATIYSKAFRHVHVGITTVREVLKSLELDGFYVSYLKTSMRDYTPYPAFDSEDRPRVPYTPRSHGRGQLRRPFGHWPDGALQRYLELAEACGLACAEVDEKHRHGALTWVSQCERNWWHRVELLRGEIVARSAASANPKKERTRRRAAEVRAFSALPLSR